MQYSRSELETLKMACEKLLLLWTPPSLIRLVYAQGNHCLRCPRAEVTSVLGMPSSYYTASLVNGWRLIALDTTEMSGHSHLPEVMPGGAVLAAFHCVAWAGR